MGSNTIIASFSTFVIEPTTATEASLHGIERMHDQPEESGYQGEDEEKKLPKANFLVEARTATTNSKARKGKNTGLKSLDF